MKLSIVVIIQGINNARSYTLHVVDITKKDNRIIRVKNTKNIESLTMKKLTGAIALILKKQTIDLLITPIPFFLDAYKLKSIYHPRIGVGSKVSFGDYDGKKRFNEGLAISYFYELLPIIEARGAFDDNFSSSIFVDDGAKENTYRLNHYEVNPLTLAFIYSIWYVYQREIDVLLDFYEEWGE